MHAFEPYLASERRWLRFVISSSSLSCMGTYPGGSALPSVRPLSGRPVNCCISSSALRRNSCARGRSSLSSCHQGSPLRGRFMNSPGRSATSRLGEWKGRVGTASSTARRCCADMTRLGEHCDPAARSLPVRHPRLTSSMNFFFRCTARSARSKTVVLRSVSVSLCSATSRGECVHAAAISSSSCFVLSARRAPAALSSLLHLERTPSSLLHLECALCNPLLRKHLSAAPLITHAGHGLPRATPQNGAHS